MKPKILLFICFEGRSSQGINSICACPMVSSGAPAPPVFAFSPPSPAKAKVLCTPGVLMMMASACFSRASFSCTDRLPRA